MDTPLSLWGRAGYLNQLLISRSDRMIRLITSKDHADSSSCFKCSSRSKRSSLDPCRLDGRGEEAALSEKFDHEMIEEPGLLDL